MIIKLTQLACLCLCFLPVWLLARRPWKRPLAREIALGTFVVFTAGMLVMVFRGDWSSPAAMLRSAAQRLHSRERINLVPFTTIVRTFRSHPSSTMRMDFAGNILLFMPWGFFLPLLWRKFRTPLRMTAMALLLTLSIEMIQLFIMRTVDVDDVLLNFCGSMGGALLWWLLHKAIPASDTLAR